MATKAYNAQQALNPGQPEQGQGEDLTAEQRMEKLMSELPEEFRDEVIAALGALVSYIHSEEGTTEILDSIQSAKGKEAQQIGIAALQAMDAADQDHQWREPVKVMAGYMAVAEIANLAREAMIVDIPQEQEGEIFQQAAQNYIHAVIKNKPTREERDSEAIRIQQEVEPLMNEKMRGAGHEAAKANGIPYEARQAQAQAAPPQQAGGLLE